MGMCRENVCGIVWEIYRDYGLVVASKNSDIKKCPMRQNVSWDTLSHGALWCNTAFQKNYMGKSLFVICILALKLFIISLK